MDGVELCPPVQAESVLPIIIVLSVRERRVDQGGAGRRCRRLPFTDLTRPENNPLLFRGCFFYRQTVPEYPQLR